MFLQLCGGNEITLKDLLTLGTLLTILFCNIIVSQPAGSLRGFVADSINGESIIYANVVIKDVNRGSSTNSKGYYYIPAIPIGERTVIISYLGYRTKTTQVIISENKITELDIQLVPSTIELDDVQIIADKTVRQNETDLGLQKITIREVEYLPAGIESDIFKAIQALPGVSSTGDVTAKYYVRGGGGDQNEVLVNGVPIYNPFHALGIFSVVDPEMISVLEFYKGGFEPKYGSRLSSILNVVTRDGNKNKFEATAQASLLAGKLALEGPIPGGSFITTVRKSYYSEILKNYLNKEAPIDFYDLSFKANYTNPDIDKGSKLVVHGFYSSDRINNDDPFKEDYSVNNLSLGLNWRKVWSSPLFSYISLYYCRYNAQVFPKHGDAKERFNSLTDIALTADFTYVYDSKDELQFGVHNKYLGVELNQESLSGDFVKFDQTGWDLSFYFNYKFYRWDNIGLDLGFRSKLIGLSKHRPFIIEPRFAFTYLPNPLIALKIALGWYSQEIVTLTNENELISLYEPWIIIPDYLNAPQALHLIAGIKSYLTENFTVEVEGYFKDIANLFDINEQKFTQKFFDYNNVDGEAYGLDFLMRYQFFPVYFRISYSLGWAYKISGNEKYYPRYDRRHSLNILFNVTLGKGWETSSTWFFATGMPFTPIAGFYDRLENEDDPLYLFNENFVPSTLFGVKNSKRLPVYHRLDFSINKNLEIGAADVSLGASIINAYDRKNVFYYDRKTGKQVNMLPFMPSVFVKVKL